MLMTCNSCGKDFTLSQKDILIIREGEYEVSYFICPRCNKKYQVFTSDESMRELIKKRTEVQRKIFLAKTKRFTEKKFRAYLKELDLIKHAQEEMMPALKKIGDEMLSKLSEGGNNDGSKHNPT